MSVNYLTASMDDVIARSALMHPSLLAESLTLQAKEHRAYARKTYRSDVSRIAQRMADDCLAAAAAVEGETLGALSFAAKISAFNIAANLLCLPRSLRAEIAERSHVSA